ncbi:MAG: hypothetical protein Q6362_005830 [Candidatus Wukongarchaeota archaeon]|nr:hypothetical protein [Candidatus Wukongarchaeota archaeon]
MFSRIETQTIELLNQALQDEEEHRKKYLASPFRIRSATEFFKSLKKIKKVFAIGLMELDRFYVWNFLKTFVKDNKLIELLEDENYYVTGNVA